MAVADGAPNTSPFFFVELLLVVSFYDAMARMMRSTDLPVEGPASRHAWVKPETVGPATSGR